MQDVLAGIPDLADLYLFFKEKYANPCLACVRECE